MDKKPIVGKAGAAGFCKKCPKKTDVHVVGVGSFCAKHYLENVREMKIPLSPELLSHYKRLAGEE